MVALMKTEPEKIAPTEITEARTASAQGTLVESIADETQRARAARRIELPSGRAVEAEPGGVEGDRVTIRGTSGEVELTVLMTENGPVLRFRAAEMELSAKGAVKVDCERLHVRAEKGIVEETGGDLQQTVAGDATLKVRGRLRAAAAKTRIEAKRGDVEIEANDDVQLLGERIKLNC
jgi:uncharacterized protein (DUF2345 family)